MEPYGSYKVILINSHFATLSLVEKGLCHVGHHVVHPPLEPEVPFATTKRSRVGTALCQPLPERLAFPAAEVSTKGMEFFSP